jgi:hypothetical protein
MDKFEQLIHNVSEMSANDQNKAIEDYKGSCICKTCATYTQCAADTNQKLFCVTGKNKNCITEVKGCECPICPLAQSLDVGISHHVYCINGSEMQQR